MGGMTYYRYYQRIIINNYTILINLLYGTLLVLYIDGKEAYVIPAIKAIPIYCTMPIKYIAADNDIIRLHMF